jgi:DNA repair protein RecO (recombination protein O)
MPKITQSDILSSFHSVRDNFGDFVNASRLAEILISLLPEDVPNRKLFLFFLNIMHLLESSDLKKKDAIYLISQIRLLAVLGYAPRLKGCGKCSIKSHYFYPDAGTIMCKSCAENYPNRSEQPLKIADKTIQFYSHGMGWPIRTSSRLKPAPDTVSELTALLDAHITHITSRRLHTSDFLSRL